MSLAIDLQKELQQFTGTEQYYKNLGLLYTDGIKNLADRAGAYWLIDLIASYQPKCRRNEDLRDFQVWYLTRPGATIAPWLTQPHESGCIVTCWSDTPNAGEAPIVRQDVPFTDFPLVEIKLYVCGGVLMIPSEY
jgi:hypothetical protein